MKLSGHAILLTGGSSGIGLALAERLLAKGNVVVVTGRRRESLDETKAKLPALHTIVSDSGDAGAREKLVREVTERFPELDVVINNAGIQRKIDLVAGEAWEATREELAINLEGPMHMCALVLPHLLAKPKAVLANVSSGLAFVPMARMPVYCATKAALHSFTLSLRHQLRATSVEVVEIIPPAVHSNLGGSHAFGVPTDEYADSVMRGLEAGSAEVTYQFSDKMSQGSRAELDAAFQRMNG